MLDGGQLVVELDQYIINGMDMVHVTAIHSVVNHVIKHSRVVIEMGGMGFQGNWQE